MLGETIGRTIPAAASTADVGIVTATLQIRNSLDLTLLNNKLNRRLGCQFVDLPRSMLAPCSATSRVSNASAMPAWLA
jgi:hypothetical protein